MFRLDGRVALVTGSSRGIGRATAERLAGQGAHVLVHYASNESAAREVEAGIVAAGGSAEVVCFDVADASRTEATIAEAAKRAGRLDILVASAGVAFDGLLLRLKPEDIDRTFAVNVGGAMTCARAATRVMMRARWGRVVFLSSVVGETGNAGQAAYAASKAALLGLAKSLAREYASRAITVNAVAPGWIDTDMTRGLSPEQLDAMRSRVPLDRAGTPADVAAAIAYLCSEEAGYVTGQVLRVNGGMYM